MIHNGIQLPLLILNELILIKVFIFQTPFFSEVLGLPLKPYFRDNGFWLIQV